MSNEYPGPAIAVKSMNIESISNADGFCVPFRNSTAIGICLHLYGLVSVGHSFHRVPAVVVDHPTHEALQL